MSTLADIIRTVNGNLSRQQLKVARARLRRLGLTHLNAEKGPYALDPNGSEDTSRTVAPALVTAAIAA